MEELIAFLAVIGKWAASPAAATAVWVLFLISEALAYVPQIKANSVFQGIKGFINWVYDKVRSRRG